MGVPALLFVLEPGHSLDRQCYSTMSMPGGVQRPGFTYQSSFGRHRTRRACSLLRLTFFGRMAEEPVFRC